MNVSRQIVKQVFGVALVCCFVSVFFSAVTYFSSRGELAPTDLWKVISTNLFRFGLWGALFPFLFHFVRRVDSSGQRLLLQAFLYLGSAFIFSTAHFAGFILLQWLVSKPDSPEFANFLEYGLAAYLGDLFLGFFIYAVIVSVSIVQIRNRRFVEQEKRSALLQSQLTGAQLQALKMQLQPHFLFNTLNSISSLVASNPVQAQEMIAKLGDFLRMTLDSNESQMVTLREEVNFLRSYLEIEQIRFFDKMQIVFDIPDDTLEALLPHLLLQPIVENSVKHGMSQLTKDGKIEISSAASKGSLEIKIRDNGETAIPVNTSDDENKTGLANVRSRLEHIYGEKFVFEMTHEPAQGTTVSISIPFTEEFYDAKHA
ncbi:MAG: histidine kinase [Pyrinomonadaceae bacterium]